jgi:rhodanese-related sulfurtransferase
MMREALILLALTLAAATVTHFFHPRAPAWHEAEEPAHDDEVSLADISRNWRHEVLWIDARPRARYEQEHIPGAINLNEQELETQLFDNIAVLQDNRKPVVVYCAPGGCQASRKVRDYLAPRLPGEDFFVLRGGWSAWLEARGK